MFSERPKYVILEGTDGSGKSTLAQQIFRHFDCQEVHPVGPPATDDVFAEYVADVSRFLWNPRMTVFDRFHFGTVAYGREFRGKPDLTEDQYAVLERLLKNLGTLVVYCEPPWDHVKKVLNQRTELSEYEKDIGKLGTVRDWMRWCFKETELRKFQYDYTVKNSIDLLYKVMEDMGFRTRYAS